MFFKLNAFIGLIKKKKYDFIRIFVMIEITLTSVSLSGSTRNKFRGDVTAFRGEVIHLGGDVTEGAVEDMICYIAKIAAVANLWHAPIKKNVVREVYGCIIL